MNAFDTAHTDTAADARRYDAIYQKLELLFNEIITVRTDDAALKKLKVIASDLSIENWDWSQGVGIYGIWRRVNIVIWTMCWYGINAAWRKDYRRKTSIAWHQC